MSSKLVIEKKNLEDYLKNIIGLSGEYKNFNRDNKRFDTLVRNVLNYLIAIDENHYSLLKEITDGNILKDSGIAKELYNLLLSKDFENYHYEYSYDDDKDNFDNPSDVNNIICCYLLRYFDDIWNLREDFISHGLTLTMKQLSSIWSIHSDDYSAGWLGYGSSGNLTKNRFNKLCSIGIHNNIIKEYNADDLKKILSEYVDNGLTLSEIHGKIYFYLNNEVVFSYECK